MIQLAGTTTLLQVYDMPESLQFYRNVVGFTVVEASGDTDEADWVLLKHGDCNLMLNTRYEKSSRPSSRDDVRQQVHADTIIYFGCPDIDAAYEMMKQRGLAISPPYITGYGWKALNCQDPDGYAICFHWPVNN